MAAVEETSKFSEAYPMKGGDGPNSYANNSTFQKGAVDGAKELLSKAVAEKLDLLSSNTFYIADLGCSVGPNTFISVENIIEAVEFKFHSQGLNSQIPEFQVFFNDHTLNDFNRLFKSLPQTRRYYAAGVPGSFYGRLFPSTSIHFFHSTFALHWLSRVPKEVVDKNSPAWNKGRIHYSNSPDEVVRAYEAQHAEDMECFLNARAQEIADGGIMVLVIPGRPNTVPHSDSLGNVSFQLIGSCLMDMARKGVVSEDKVDTFNFPVYYMTPQELEAAVERNEYFSLKKLETVPHVPIPPTVSPSQLFVSLARAAFEEVIKQQFGEEILDELFDSYLKKLEEQPSIIASATETAIIFLAVLKRM
ncbi:loganic acid O-methyltransferase-like isoform X2 [Malus sylvestris]|uniref:loganic acid O-methyltransferase-like isoform X2 n=1 Tax=Malus sylvestris TaxID=3752 RepID=UPI0021AD3BB5|nr:loganic acid O-methyltransferase-like isoform X2 [Malus sylvestris]